VDFENIVSVGVIYDASIGQLRETVQMSIPIALSIEQRLAARRPDRFDNRLQGWPIDRLEVFGPDERHTSPMHPDCNGYVSVRIKT